MEGSHNVALVFGASGISGWAVTKNLLSYPSANTFSRIIALTNRPRSLEKCGLPLDPRLERYSGINLRTTLEEVLEGMKGEIPNINEVTHMYYCAYSNATSFAENVTSVKEINTEMTYNAVHATDRLCSDLRFVVLQTGSNHYGVAVFEHLDKFQINPPLKENNPRVSTPYGDEIFYYAQVDLVREAAKGKQWGWCEVRPDVIIGNAPVPGIVISLCDTKRYLVGFVPTETGMNLLEPVALYLALYRFVHGPGATVPFPGSLKSFAYTHTDTSQDIMTKAEIYLSVVKPTEANNEAFNVADTATPGPWSVKWPMLAGYFELKGTCPSTDEWGGIDQWWNEHQEDYQKMCEMYGLQRREISESAWIFSKVSLTMLSHNRELSLDKIRSIGFTEELPVGQGHYVTVDRMVNERILPPKSVLAGSHV